MSNIILFLTLINPGVGIEAGFCGGPVFSFIMIVELNDRFSFNGTIGGFPGIILVSRANCRFQFTRTEWSPYLQTGLGYFHYYRGNAKGKSIKETHLDLGLIWPNNNRWTLNGDIGLLYAPFGLNKWLKDEFPDIPIFIYPAIHAGFSYFLK